MRLRRYQSARLARSGPVYVPTGLSGEEGWPHRTKRMAFIEVRLRSIKPSQRHAWVVTRFGS